MRKQPVGGLNPWDESLEPGDRVLGVDDKMYDLRESNGWGKRALGELTPFLASPHKKGRRAILIGSEWYWEWD